MSERPVIEPLYLEAIAADMLGIRPDQLARERKEGRITYRKVAGRVMYRADDIAAWQENVACRARPRDQSSGLAESGAALSTSTGLTPGLAAAASVQRALATAQRLTKSSRNGSTGGVKNPSPGMAPVVPLRQP